jgi:hypothetical protein
VLQKLQREGGRSVVVSGRAYKYKIFLNIDVGGVKKKQRSRQCATVQHESSHSGAPAFPNVSMPPGPVLMLRTAVSASAREEIGK